MKMILITVFLVFIGCSNQEEDDITYTSPSVTINLLNNYSVEMHEICLNGYVYYLGRGWRQSVMAPKYITPTTVETCKGDV
jgi:hypothetical protein